MVVSSSDMIHLLHETLNNYAQLNVDTTVTLTLEFVGKKLYMAAVCSCSSFSTACEIRRQLPDEVAEDMFG